MGRKADVIHGPFDPGGLPETRSGNPIELGLFAWNLASGMTGSKAVLADTPRLRDFWHWDRALHLNQLAERIGFEYQVPFIRWHGYGGTSGYLDDALDFMASVASLAPVTSRLGLFSTVHVTYKFQPLHIAKMGATIDFISKGRWGLNVVTGSGDAIENRMFGQQPYQHDEAYEVADEFVTLMKWLWTSEEPIDFEGRYYQSFDGVVRPGPYRKPRPVLMNAGNSPAGLDFAARQCDWAFLTCDTLEEYRETINKVHRLATKYGRTVRPATVCYVFMAETDERARAVMNWVEEEVDREAVDGFILNLTRSTRQVTTALKGASAHSVALQSREASVQDEWYGLGRSRYMRWALGVGSWRLCGSCETVAEEIRRFKDIGIESVLLTFFDPLRGLHQMEDDVIPLLKKMGLRK